MKQLGKGFTGFAVWVGFAAVANGCGGWVDLKSSGGGVGGEDSAVGGTGSVAPVGGSSRGGSQSTAAAGALTGGGAMPVAGSAADAGPFEVLVAPEPEIFPPGAAGPGVTWRASVKVYAGTLAEGALAGAIEYCFSKPLGGNTCDWQAGAPFVWTEGGGMVVLDVAALGGVSYFPTRVTRDGKTVVGSFRKANDEFGLFRWTEAAGAAGLGEPAGSSGFEYLSDDGKTVAGMFKANDKGHVNFLWTEADGFQPLDTASGWPSTTETEVRGLSADGAVLFGVTVGVGASQVFRHAQGESEQLGSLPGFPNCDLGYGALSRGGEAVFGRCASQDQQTGRAFRWSETTQLVALSNEACQMSGVWAVSASGTSSFGLGACNGVNGLVRWTDGAAGMTLLVAPSGFEFDSLHGSSHDGGVAIGMLRSVSSEPTTAPLPGEPLPPVPNGQPFRWSEAEGVQPLPLVSGQSYGYANAIAPSGEVVVGRAGRGENDTKAVLWDGSGQLELEAYLASQGVELQGVELNTAQDVVVRDGMIHILGYADATNLSGAWLVRIPLVRPQ